MMHEKSTQSFSGTQAPISSRRSYLVAIVVCMAAGVLIAALPHAVNYLHTGSAQYVANNDDALYLALSRAPYWGEWGPRDAFAAQRDHMPTTFADVLFVPWAKLAGALGLSPLLIGVVWRIIGGALLGLSVFVLLHRLLQAATGSPRIMLLAAGLAVLLTCDPALGSGEPVIGLLRMVRLMLAHTDSGPEQAFISQYRVVSPLLDLPWLLLLIACLVPSSVSASATTRIPWLRWIAGTLCLTMCVYTYFYYWTAATAALGLIIVGRLIIAKLQPKNRTAHLFEARLAAAVLVCGLVLGLPQIMGNAQLATQPEFHEALQRMARGMHMAPGDPLRMRNLRNFPAWATLFVGGIILLRRRRQTAQESTSPASTDSLATVAGVLCAFIVAAYALKNVGLLGLEFENFHWGFVATSAGAMFVIVLGVCVARRVANPRTLTATAWALAGVMLLSAASFRAFETTHSREAVQNTKILAELRPLSVQFTALGPDDVLAGPFAANLAVLYGRAGQLFMTPHTLHGSLVSDREAYERQGLNAWLMGETPEQYRVEARPPRVLSALESSLPQWQPDAVEAARMEIFQQILTNNGSPFLARYRPTALLLPANALAPTRGGPWTLSGTADQWALWIRR
jgi:hypothetical protein